MTTIPPHIAQTLRAYDKNAKAYADKFENYDVYKKQILEFHKKYIRQNSHILDLGCGPGSNMHTIAEHDSSCRFTGVDISTSFISMAQQRFPQFEFICQDIREVKLNRTFDVVLASFCIVHLQDEEVESVIHMISNLLPPAGYLYLSYMNGTASGFETTSFSREKIFFNYFDDGFICKLLTDNQLEILDINKEDYLETDMSVTVDTFISAVKR